MLGREVPSLCMTSVEQSIGKEAGRLCMGWMIVCPKSSGVPRVWASNIWMKIVESGDMEMTKLSFHVGESPRWIHVVNICSDSLMEIIRKVSMGDPSLRGGRPWMLFMIRRTGSGWNASSVCFDCIHQSMSESKGTKVSATGNICILISQPARLKFLPTNLPISKRGVLRDTLIDDVQFEFCHGHHSEGQEQDDSCEHPSNGISQLGLGREEICWDERID